MVFYSRSWAEVSCDRPSRLPACSRTRPGTRPPHDARRSRGVVSGGFSLTAHDQPEPGVHESGGMSQGRGGIVESVSLPSPALFIVRPPLGPAAASALEA